MVLTIADSMLSFKKSNICWCTCKNILYDGHTLILVSDCSHYKVNGFGLEASHIAWLVACPCFIGPDLGSSAGGSQVTALYIYIKLKSFFRMVRRLTMAILSH